MALLAEQPALQKQLFHDPFVGPGPYAVVQFGAAVDMVKLQFLSRTAFTTRSTENPDEARAFCSYPGALGFALLCRVFVRH
ncbi:MAG TPA: hypothetical protein PKZ27_03090 [Rhodocyclaceae bacterium]|nr:hypothetical protein [Rhodocyclaceae bacterium]